MTDYSWPRFVPGELYDVGTSLGSYLLAIGAAEPLLDETPARIVPFNSGANEAKGVSRREPLATAADQSPRRR